VINYQIIKSFLEKNSASGSKSTILAPLAWLIGICFGALIVLISINAHTNYTYIVLGIILLAAFLFFFVYIYCLFKDRDALRSEKFTIQKIAIQRGIYGDNIVGKLEDKSDDIKLLKTGDNSEKRVEDE
jgi:glucan phosphoethanolaminetransferase (alkaline phosphatase superfamily)